MNARGTILAVEDEPKLLRLVKLTLEREGYSVLTAAYGREALEILRTKMPDLVILDILLPDMDGYEVCRTLRSFSDVPVIMLTSKARESDKLLGFESGADDYVTKPFSCPELVARVKAVLNRTCMSRSAENPTRYKVGELDIDYLRRRVFVRGREVKLTATEYALLQCLASNAGKVMLHEELLTRIWGPSYRDEYQYLRNYVSNLRKKIEEDPSNPRYILSKPGIGYYLADS